MNICYIVDSCEEFRMGLFYSAHNRIKNFHDKGHVVTVLSVRKYHSFFLQLLRRLLGAEVKKKGKSSFNYEGITYRYVWYKETLLSYILEKVSFPYIYYSFYVNRIKRDFSLDNLDLIVAHWGLECALFAKELGRSLCRPYIVYYHGSDINSTPPSWKKVVKNVMNHAKFNVFVSEALQCKAQTIYGKINNSSVIYNGYESSVFYKKTKGDIDNYKRKLHIQGRTVGFVGNLEWVKRADCLPDIFDKVKKIHKEVSFIVVGDGSLRSMLEARCHDVIFLGQVSNKEVADLMGIMDVMILPSRKEGYPMVLVEALACGTPCVANNTGGIPEILSLEYLVDIDYGIDLFVDKVCDVLEGKIKVNNKPIYSWSDIYNQEYKLFESANENISGYSGI